jgi:hypothetical protein
MKEIPCQIERWSDVGQMSRTIESVISGAGLRQTLKGTLRGYPGCVHWHFAKNGATGTLEVTLWPAQRRAWFSVQARRGADWIDESLPRLRLALERELNKVTADSD